MDPRETAGRRIRTLLADDDRLVREGIATILSSDPSIEVVAQAADGLGLCDAARAHPAEVALVDIRMPRMDGLEATTRLRKLVPQVRVVILTTFAEAAYIEDALRRGASGYLLKSAAPQELLLGVRAVTDGGACFSPRVARWLLDRSTGPARRRERALAEVARLTGRQRDILAALGEGLPNAEIGRRLYLSENTVKGYVSEILDRLRLDNRVLAAILAYEAGLARRDPPQGAVGAELDNPGST
jgi:DNA-binding NarL/FixJ family response regulator